jgi:hypothetical protein
MTNVVSFAEARATYRRISEPTPDNLGDPRAPMRGILLGFGLAALMWIVAWRLVLLCAA